MTVRPHAALPAAMFTRMRALQQKKMRQRYGEFLVEGKRLTAEALHSQWRVKFICAAEDRLGQIPFLSGAGSIPVYSVPPKKFSEISATEHSQGVLAVVEAKRCAPQTIPNGESAVLALDAIADPGNVGTIIRAADWFGAAAVLLGKNCAELFNPKTVRATVGSLFHLPVCGETDLERSLHEYRNAGFHVYAATNADMPVGADFHFARRALFVIGSEAEGIRRELLALCDEKITIKKYGAAESLNAAMAASILLARWRS